MGQQADGYNEALDDAFVDRLLELAGDLGLVPPTKYQITVTDLAFGWSPIEPEVLDVFSGYFFPTMDLAAGNDVQRRLTRHLSRATEPVV